MKTKQYRWCVRCERELSTAIERKLGICQGDAHHIDDCYARLADLRAARELINTYCPIA